MFDGAPLLGQQRGLFEKLFNSHEKDLFRRVSEEPQDLNTISHAECVCVLVSVSYPGDDVYHILLVLYVLRTVPRLHTCSAYVYVRVYMHASLILILHAVVRVRTLSCTLPWH